MADAHFDADVDVDDVNDDDINQKASNKDPLVDYRGLHFGGHNRRLHFFKHAAVALLHCCSTALELVTKQIRSYLAKKIYLLGLKNQYQGTL